MAALLASSALVRPTAVVAQAKSTRFTSNATIKKTTAFKVWQPNNNKFFETFSFLPPLSNDEISKQINYFVANGWTPCLEFSDEDQAYVGAQNMGRFGGSATPGYYDNRYWTFWKLPMFGCTDGSQVLAEVQACTKAFPNAYVRVVAFDASRQVQVAGFLVHRPSGAKDCQPPAGRSV